MKCAAFITIICLLLIMALLMTKGVMSDRHSCSNASMIVKLRVMR